MHYNGLSWNTHDFVVISKMPSATKCHLVLFLFQVEVTSESNLDFKPIWQNFDITKNYEIFKYMKKYWFQSYLLWIERERFILRGFYLMSNQCQTRSVHLRLGANEIEAIRSTKNRISSYELHLKLLI